MGETVVRLNKFLPVIENLMKLTILKIVTSVSLLLFAASKSFAGSIDKIVDDQTGAISIGTDGYFHAGSNAKFYFRNLKTGQEYVSSTTQDGRSFIKYFQSLSDEEVRTIKDDYSRRIQQVYRDEANKYDPTKDKPAIVSVPPGNYKLVAIKGRTVNGFYRPKFIRTDFIEPWFNPIKVEAGKVVHLGSILIQNVIINNTDGKDSPEFKAKKSLVEDAVLPVPSIRDDKLDARAYFDRKYPSDSDKIVFEFAKPVIDPRIFVQEWNALEIDYTSISSDQIIAIYNDLVGNTLILQ